MLTAPDLACRRDAVTRSAIAMIAGILLSGPLALLVVALVHPQPAWRDAATFADAFHPVQLLPYAFGFLLIGGCIALVASLAAIAPGPRANLALALAAAFGALILLNYILQTTFVPALVRPFHDDQAPLVAALTMVNPRSLAWALEMWGYAVLGVALWLLAGVLHSRAVAIAIAANGIVSLAGGVLTALLPGWEITVAGGIAFAAWNALMIVLGILVIVAVRRRPL